MNNNAYNQNMGQGMPNPQYSNMNSNQPQKKTNPIVKILAIIGGVFVGAIVLIFVIIGLVSANSDKLVCKSDEGNITIMYNDSEITGYTAVGITYDLDQQKSVAQQIGVQSYLDEFTTWFETNTTGTCTIKEK